MSDWGVVDFVSRVAERVTNAGEGLAAQLIDRTGEDTSLAVYGPLVYAMPRVEPSPDFVVELRRQLLTSPIVVETLPPARFSLADRRVVYGVAAVGSLASVAAVVVILLRSRGVDRAAA